jgi:hypothetical protein
MLSSAHMRIRRAGICLIICLGIDVLVVVVLRQDRTYQIIVALIIALVALVPLFVASCVALGRLLRGKALGYVARVLECSAYGVFGLAGVYPVGCAVQRSDVRDAKAWVESTVPLVDSYYQTWSRYPSGLMGVVDESTAPYLWKAERVLFRSDADGYSFDIATSMYSGAIWSSSTRSWVEYD